MARRPKAPGPLERFCPLCQAHPGQGCVTTVGRPHGREHAARSSGPTSVPPERGALQPRQQLLPERPAPAPIDAHQLASHKRDRILHLAEQLEKACGQRREMTAAIDYLRQELLDAGMPTHTLVRRFREPHFEAALDQFIAYPDAITLGPGEVEVLPAMGYRELIAAMEGPDRVEVWVSLGLALHEQGGWRFGLLDDGCSVTWTRIERPEFMATASISQGGTFTLFRQHDDGTADSWDFDRPELIAALFAALAAGVPAPAPTHRLGPWIEQPFVQWLRGEEPDWELRGPLVSIN